MDVQTQNIITRVPHHLLETQIYSAVGGNEILKATPQILEIDEFTVNKRITKTIKIINVSSKTQVYHVLDPLTPYFSIEYKKTKKFIPGSVLTINVFFCPKEWKYHYDAIRVFCEEENIVIPIHCHPVAKFEAFTGTCTFPKTPLGTCNEKIILLKNPAPIDLEFEVSTLEFHPSFSFSPSFGVMKADETVEFSIRFFPLDLTTAVAKLCLKIKQYEKNNKPRICTFIGNPVLDLPEREETVSERRGKAVSPKYFRTTVHNSKMSKKKLQIIEMKKKLQMTFSPQLAAKLVRSATLAKEQIKGETPSKKLHFLRQLRQNEELEKTSRLKWMVKTGHKSLANSGWQEIVDQQESDFTDYEMNTRQKPQLEEGLARKGTLVLCDKVMRPAHQVPANEPIFEEILNNCWSLRFQLRYNYVQAARKVIAMNRANFILRKFAELRKLVKNGVDIEKAADLVGGKAPPTIFDTPIEVYEIRKDQIYAPKFPHFYSEISEMKQLDSKDLDLEPQLGHVKNIPYLDLKIPVQYKILKYDWEIPQIFEDLTNIVTPTPKSTKNIFEDEEIRNVKTGGKKQSGSLMTLPNEDTWVYGDHNVEISGIPILKLEPFGETTLERCQNPFLGLKAGATDYDLTLNWKKWQTTRSEIFTTFRHVSFNINSSPKWSNSFNSPILKTELEFRPIQAGDVASLNTAEIFERSISIENQANCEMETHESEKQVKLKKYISRKPVLKFSEKISDRIEAITKNNINYK